MATASFDKRIVIGNAAAKRLSAMFAEPVKPLPNIDNYVKQSESAWKRYLNHSKK